MWCRRLRELAASGTVQPGEALAATLREHGLLGAGVQLPGTEARAAALLDVLHPDGIGGVLAQSGQLLADPAVRGRLGDLLHPALLALAMDPELLALVVVAGIAITRSSVSAPTMRLAGALRGRLWACLSRGCAKPTGGGWAQSVEGQAAAGGCGVS